MVLKKTLYFLLFSVIFSCIEPYEFTVTARDSALVVEAFISDQSFNETVLIPSDGRYFYVKLSETGNVINTRPVPVSSASVRLLNDQGQSWDYLESDPVKSPGVYLLREDDFKAAPNVGYKLQITTSDENAYESGWESMTAVPASEMGEIGFVETDIQTYATELGKKIIKTVRGMTATIQLPQNTLQQPVYYRWSFTPMWIYQAPLSASVVLPGYRCWISNNIYLKDYALQFDLVGGYSSNLFFMPTVRNERIFEDFTVVVTQQLLTEDYYFFWKEMQEQSKAGAIFDSPPFNLGTNLVSANDENRVVGYFGVVQEQAKRWYFNKKDLSYHVENTLRADCTVPFQDVAPECFDCRQYSFGEATNIKPSWWR